MFYGEIINYFIPFHINKFDRAIALEEAWEDEWKDMYNKIEGTNKDRINLMGTSFDSTITRNRILPAVFINSTEVETGLQCLWSNVGIQHLPKDADRDLYVRMKKDINYSTAIGLSARFPLFSPGGMFCDHCSRRHLVDGGYFENKGAETLLQVLKEIHGLRAQKVLPIVIQFNFAGSDSTFKSVRSFNEIKEIVDGLFNTRSGRAAIAENYLTKYVRDSFNTGVVDMKLTLKAREFPMNWVLSNAAIQRMNAMLYNSMKESHLRPGHLEDILNLKTTDKGFTSQ
jgi:hypothetical protein